MPVPAAGPTSVSFCLQLRPAAAGCLWQAEVRDAEGGQLAVFTSPLELLRYLTTAADPRPSPGGVR